jgi:hypothetical protein
MTLCFVISFIAAPIVDAIACDDCRDLLPVRGMQQTASTDADPRDGSTLSSDAGPSAPQGTATAQDLCPVCANIGAATGNASCGALLMISSMNHPQKQIALLDPSYPITKPPQI